MVCKLLCCSKLDATTSTVTFSSTAQPVSNERMQLSSLYQDWHCAAGMQPGFVKRRDAHVHDGPDSCNYRCCVIGIRRLSFGASCMTRARHPVTGHRMMTMLGRTDNGAQKIPGTLRGIADIYRMTWASGVYHVAHRAIMPCAPYRRSSEVDWHLHISRLNLTAYRLTCCFTGCHIYLCKTKAACCPSRTIPFVNARRAQAHVHSTRGAQLPTRPQTSMAKGAIIKRKEHGVSGDCTSN
jgi:hypothetical protein